MITVIASVRRCYCAPLTPFLTFEHITLCFMIIKVTASCIFEIPLANLLCKQHVTHWHPSQLFFITPGWTIKLAKVKVGNGEVN